MSREWRPEHTVLLVFVAGNFAQLGSRLVISPLVPRMLESFQVSKAAMGLALTGMWAAYAIFQLPGGVLGERFGQRPLVIAALVGAAIGSVLVAASPVFALFGVFVVAFGAATGLFFSPAASLLAEQFENIGSALSTVTAGGAVAGLLAPVAAAEIASRFGWRAAILLGLVAIPVAGAVVRFVPPTAGDPSVRMRDRVEPGALLELLGRPTVLFTLAIAVVGVFTFQALTSFLPTFLVEHRGMSDGQAALAFGVVFLLSAVAQPVAGSLSDALGRDATLAASLTLTGSGIGLLLVGSAPVALFGVALLGAGVSWPGVVQARFMDALSEAERDVGFGLVRTAYMLLGATASVITGAAADHWGWLVAYGIVIGLLSLAVTALAVNRLLRTGL